MSNRLAAMVTVGVLGGGLVGFYIQHKMIEKYGIKLPELDKPLRSLADKAEPQVPQTPNPVDDSVIVSQRQDREQQ